VGRHSIAVEVDSIEWGRSLVEDGKGISFYHIKNVEKEVSEGRLKILHLIDDIQVGVDVLVRRDVILPPIANRFISLARETFSVPADAHSVGKGGGPKCTIDRTFTLTFSLSEATR